MTKKVIELIRVSTESQAAEDRASIPAQRAVNRRTAQAYSLDIVRSIEMTDVSGTAVLYAPEIRDLMRLIEDPSIVGVVTREFSRLMRPEDFGDYVLLQKFADTNTVLYFPDGPVDLSTKTGKMMGAIRAAFAGYERNENLERIWTAKEQKRRQGKLAQSHMCLPFGVAYDEATGFRYTADAERAAEVFRLFLSGEVNYREIGRQTGIQYFNVPNILRNRIYTGWRVIDKKRDLSSAGKMVKRDGRQGDRRKIARSADDIIRVKVIEQGVVSQRDFERVQELMQAKRERHWRTQPGYEHRFTYNGFLFCSTCGANLYGAFSRRDYYICKDRLAGKCKAPYMQRERIEPMLDDVFGRRVTDRKFLHELATEIERNHKRSDSASRVVSLQAQITKLQSKRVRVVDSYMDGVIDRAERDARLAKVDRELSAINQALLRVKPAGTVSVEQLRAAFEPFLEWRFLSRKDRRAVLSAVVPEIRAADYTIEGMYVSLPGESSLAWKTAPLRIL